MTSILTNTAAMAALQTLRSIDDKMETTQGRVSSGLRVGTAADNAAYWSIATTMRSDNSALSAVQDALGLGAAKVDTAYAAMETVVDVVTEIKSKLVAATEAGVDKTKIQEEIVQLQQQLKSVSESASFSGENWLQADLSSGPVTKKVVASFTRDSGGNVAVKTIDFVLDSSTILFDTRSGLAADKQGILDGTAKFEGTTAPDRSVDAILRNYKIDTASTLDLQTLGGVLTEANTGTGAAATYRVGSEVYVKYYDAAGNRMKDESGKDLWVKAVAAANANDAAAAYGYLNQAAMVAERPAGQPTLAIANGLGGAPDVLTNGVNNYYIAYERVNSSVEVKSTTAEALTDNGFSISGGVATSGASRYVDVGTNQWVKASLTAPATPNGVVNSIQIGGTTYFVDVANDTVPTEAIYNETFDLGVAVDTLDVTNLGVLAASLSTATGEVHSEDMALDYLVQFLDKQLEAVTSATSTLGSISMRIELQEDFASKLIDSIDAGIGRLVDADMNEESTRLKALQTQQQLAVQSLSIANTNSENILSLFRQ